jgi:hypothetical protein
MNEGNRELRTGNSRITVALKFVAYVQGWKSRPCDFAQGRLSIPLKLKRAPDSAQNDSLVF